MPSSNRRGIAQHVCVRGRALAGPHTSLARARSRLGYPRGTTSRNDLGSGTCRPVAKLLRDFVLLATSTRRKVDAGARKHFRVEHASWIAATRRDRDYLASQRFVGTPLIRRRTLLAPMPKKLDAQPLANTLTPRRALIVAYSTSAPAPAT